MIVLVGVGHVFDISGQVHDVIVRHMPRAVCVELDVGRYSALTHKGTKRPAPVTYRLLGEFQKRMAKEFGGEVGDEMLSATRTAREIGADILLIDADASVLFSKLWRETPAREKISLMFSALTGFFISKARVERELEEFEKDEEAYLRVIEEHYPTLKRIIIDDRNKMMAERIGEAAKKYEDVLAVVGDGHVEGISRLLGGENVKVYRLRDLRARPPSDEEARKGGNVDAGLSFSYTYEEVP